MTETQVKRSEDKRGEVFGKKKKMKQTVEIGKISYVRWNFPRAFFIWNPAVREGRQNRI